jgi:hypothetical protein
MEFSKSDAAYHPVNDTVTVCEFFFALLPVFLVEPYIDNTHTFHSKREGNIIISDLRFLIIRLEIGRL